MTGTIDYTYAVPDRCATYHLEIRYSIGDGFSGSFLQPPEEREVTIDGATCTLVEDFYDDNLTERKAVNHDCCIDRVPDDYESVVIGKWFLREVDGDDRTLYEEVAQLIIEKHEAVRM